MVDKWKQDTIKNCVKVETGSKNTEDKEENGQYPFFVRSQTVENISTYTYDEEAVLTAGDGVGTGKVFHYINGKFDVHQRVYVMTQFKQVYGKFFYYYFSKYFYDEVSKYTAKSSVDSVRKSMISDMKIMIPSTEEQRNIVEALEDVDMLVNKTEAIIQKKKNIFWGVIQALATGRQRIEGFNKEWKKVKIGEVLNIGHGQAQNEIEDKYGMYDILATSGVIGHTNSYLWDKPSVLIGRKGTIDRPQYVDKPFWTIDTLFYTKIDEDYNAKFLYYLFLLIPWKDYNEASGVPSLSSKTIKNIEIMIPEKEEQNQIEEILSSMDEEIKHYQEKLVKYKNLREGMKQDLLTGKIRLL